MKQDTESLIPTGNEGFKIFLRSGEVIFTKKGYSVPYKMGAYRGVDQRDHEFVAFAEGVDAVVEYE